MLPTTPVPPPLPPRSPKELKKMEPKKVVPKVPAADNYPKVSLQPNSCSESAAAAAVEEGSAPSPRLNLAQMSGLQVNLPESPAIVAVPLPPQRSISMVEPTYTNRLSPTTTTVEASSSQSATEETSSVKSTTTSSNHPSSNSRQSNLTPTNVYVNVSGTGGGRVQVCAGSRYGDGTATTTSNSGLLFQQQQAGLAAAGLSSSGEVHIHHHHHHHHFYPPPGPRLNMTSSASELNIPVTSTNPFLSTNPFHAPQPLNPFNQGFIEAGFANSGYGLNSSTQQTNNPVSPFAFPLTRLPISNIDLNAILRRNTQELKTCGWYHGNISMDQANRLLQGTPAGTFLVRDSSAADCLYALTFQQDTKRFPDRCANSVRIRFFESSGKFQLDPSNSCKRNQLPEFDTVVELVEFYNKSKGCPSTNVLLDEVTRVHYPINLTKPLRVERGPMSLQHLTKLKVHQSISVWAKGSPFHPDKSKRFGYREKNLQSVSSLDLPLKLKDDLSEYAYTI